MVICKSCGRKIEKGAVVCSHCGASLIARKRPKGVIVVVVLVLISALMELFKLVSYNSATAVVLGFSLSATAWRISSLLGFGICVYIAFGFFRLKKSARTILLLYILFAIVNVVLTGWHLAQNAFSSAIPNLIILLAINLAYFGALLFLVVRLKKHFVRGEQIMQACTRCKKEFEEKPHLGKQGRPFCDVCYQELIERRKGKRAAKSSAAPRSPEGRSGVGHSTQSSRKRLPKILIGVFLSVFLVFTLLVLAVFSFLYFKIPSEQRGGLFSHRSYKAGGGSMEPAIKKGGRFIVNHDYYKFHEPARWDIVVFRQQESDKRMHTSRIVALGGESIEIRNGKLRMDGSLLTPPPEVSDAVYVRKGPYGSDEYDVPEDHFYVLGDNGNSSKDSRYLGAIPTEDLIGKVIEPSYFPKQATALMQAIAEERTDRAKILIEEGADVNAKDEMNRGALMWAVWKADDEIVEFLLARGAEVNAAATGGETSLMSAAHYGQISILKMLLSEGAEVNARTAEEQTALHHAAIGGHAEAARILLDEGGADANAMDTYGNTALNYAADGGHADIVQLLEQHGARDKELIIQQKDFPVGSDIKWRYQITRTTNPDQSQEYMSHMIDCSNCRETNQVCIRTSLDKIAWYSSKDAKLPFRAIHFPLQVGSSWEERVESGEGDKDVKTLKATVVGEEMVTVPAGTFNALKIKEILVGGASGGSESYSWVAPGVGMVKKEISILDNITTVVLADSQSNESLLEATIEQGAANPFEIVSDQIPMQVGNRWTFTIRSRDQNLNGKSLIYSFYDSFEYEGRTFFRRRIEIPGVYERTIGLQVLEPNGWYGFWKPEDKTPYDVMRFPLSPGMKWEADVLNQDREGNITAGHKKWFAEAEEMIDVPAGAFQSIRIRYFNNPADSNDDSLIWLAPNVGLVKFTEKGGDTFNLESFRLFNISHEPIIREHHKQAK